MAWVGAATNARASGATPVLALVLKTTGFLVLAIAATHQTEAEASLTRLNELRAALAISDVKTAGAICHKLASSAANVGALVFAKDVRLLGQMCIAGDAVAAQHLHADLETAHPALLEELMRLQLRESA